MRPNFILVLLLLALACPSSWAQQCQPTIVPGPFTQMNGDVRAVVQFDDGRGGQCVYLGGSFTTVNGEPTSQVLRWWPGTGEWESVGAFSNPAGAGVNDLIVFDDGSGSALYAGIQRGEVVRWTGTAWSAVGTLPSSNSYLLGLSAIRLATSSRLVAASNGFEPILAWDGLSWNAFVSPTSALRYGVARSVVSPLPGDLMHRVHVIGRWFQARDPVDPLSQVTIESHCVWDGSTWTSGADSLGVLPSFTRPATLVFDHQDGNGPQLHVIDGTSTVHRFDASTRRWSGLSNELGGVIPRGWSLAAFDDGTGAKLVCDTLLGLARYEGSRWVPVVSHVFVNEFLARWPIESLTSFAASPCARPVLIVAGQYRVVGTNSVNVSYLTSCAACPADFDGSGATGVQDVLSFLQAWFAGSPAADFDGLAGVTIDDLFAFLAAWQTGCL